MNTKVIPVLSEIGGAESLCKVYTDTEFENSLPSYYYMRVVEPESPRWHTYDCERLSEDDRPAVCANETYPSLIREMAWTSPIWYRPE